MEDSAENRITEIQTPEENITSEKLTEMTGGNLGSYVREENETPQTPQAPQPTQIVKKLYRIERDKSYLMMDEEFLRKSAFVYDSDVFEYNPEDNKILKQIFDNKSKYRLNDDFKDAEEITKRLRLFGQIPSFLEIRKTENKGYGVFALNDIQENIFLGFYQGTIRHSQSTNSKNKYTFSCKDFDGKNIGTIDAENVIFANFTRWINEADNNNIDYKEHNYQVYAFTNRYIKSGEEITARYGDNYWSHFGGRLP